MPYNDEGEYVGETPFAEMQGKTLVSIKDAKVGSERVVFECSDGTRYALYYDHDCCATCTIEDITGDVADLVGVPLLMCEEVSSGKGQGPKPSEYADSWTWTFYKLRTMNGDVTMRWLGESNGWYSESVTFVQLGG